MTRQRLGKQWAGLSVSRGITLEEHLIMTFGKVLEHAGVACNHPEAVNRMLKRKKLSAEDQIIVTRHLQYLVKALDEVAPEGCYFGAHQNDSLNYGFWTK